MLFAKLSTILVLSVGLPATAGVLASSDWENAADGVDGCLSPLMVQILFGLPPGVILADSCKSPIWAPEE